MKRTHLPLVYSCSGCSSAAQTANLIAIKMDREDIAEMSCIAGVGGDVKPLVKTAKSGRPISPLMVVRWPVQKTVSLGMMFNQYIILTYLNLMW